MNNYEEIFKDIGVQHGLDVIDFIKSLSIDKQRIAIFSCYNKNKKIIDDIKKYQLTYEHDNIITKYNSIFNFNDIHLPTFIIDYILDKYIPSDIWSNPNLKWNNFSSKIIIIIIKRLMFSLRDWETNSYKRYKHILENMIFINDSENIFLFSFLIDPKSEFNLNINTGDNFDINIGNDYYIRKILISKPEFILMALYENKKLSAKELTNIYFNVCKTELELKREYYIKKNDKKTEKELKSKINLEIRGTCDIKRRNLNTLINQIRTKTKIYSYIITELGEKHYEKKYLYNLEKYYKLNFVIE